MPKTITKIKYGIVLGDEDMINAIVGKDDHLISYLKSAIEKAELIRLNIAFLMESGAKLKKPGVFFK